MPRSSDEYPPYWVVRVEGDGWASYYQEDWDRDPIEDHKWSRFIGLVVDIEKARKFREPAAAVEWVNGMDLLRPGEEIYLDPIPNPMAEMLPGSDGPLPTSVKVESSFVSR
jgi:hypothetical protein